MHPHAHAEQRDAAQGCGAQVLPASGIRSTDAEIRRGVDAACAASADNT